MVRQRTVLEPHDGGAVVPRWHRRCMNGWIRDARVR